MRAVVKGLLWTIVFAVALAAAVILYLRYGDLSRHQARIEAALSESIGHDVRIDGSLDIETGQITTLTAENVGVVNTDWQDESQLLSIGHIAISIDTWSLYEGPVKIEHLSLSDVHIRSATDAEARHNWAADDQVITTGEDERKMTTVVVNDIRLQNIVLSHDDTTVTINGAVGGSIMASPGGRPTITLDLTAQSLDLVLDLPDAERKPSNDAGEGAELLFSDEPFNATILSSINADLSIRVAILRFGKSLIEDLIVEAKLTDGTLDAGPVSFLEHDGEVEIALQLRATDSTVAANTKVDISRIHVGTPWSDEADRRSLPTLTGSLVLSGKGRTLHEIMASASGEANFKLGPGRLKPLSGSVFFGDVLLQILRALNPLHGEAPYTSLECAVVAVRAAEGIVTIDELAVQTNKMMIVGDGDIRFDNEAIDLTVRAKPREGFGISLGGVANSFVKFGGTLMAPKPRLDAAGGATTAGAAVATGGLSLIARGLWDRISAANDICGDTDN